MNKKDLLIFRDAKIMRSYDKNTRQQNSPNFEGRGLEMNNEGNRNFCFFIDDPEMAKEMLANGWNIKTLPRDPGPDDEVSYFVQVNVKYRNRFGDPVYYPPEVYLVKPGKAPTPLDENSIGSLDKKRIKKIDLVLNPSVKEDGSVKGYVRELYVTTEDSILASEFAANEHPEDDLAPGDDPFGM